MGVEVQDVRIAIQQESCTFSWAIDWAVNSQGPVALSHEKLHQLLVFFYVWEPTPEHKLKLERILKMNGLMRVSGSAWRQLPLLFDTISDSPKTLEIREFVFLLWQLSIIDQGPWKDKACGALPDGNLNEAVTLYRALSQPLTNLSHGSSSALSEQHSPKPTPCPGKVTDVTAKLAFVSLQPASEG